MYLIISLLFAVSVKLHIHTGDAASQATHGSRIAISSLDHLISAHHQIAGEVEVGLDKFPNKLTKSVGAAIIIVASPVILPVYRFVITPHVDASASIMSLPFAGTPPLRAPPV